ncbi:Transcriptional regulator, GntR family protein [Minicystis rosea]|nr:Transcriptional regulator, GntR family protein [Minicystis rosea]
MIEPTTHADVPPLRLARRMELMPPSAVREILKVAEQPDVLSFAGGLPAPELFPVEAIAESYQQVLADEGRAALQYSTTEGFGPLREWVCARMARRGVRVTTDQVLITNGSQQGIDLMARIFLDPGDVVAVENPSYLAALQTFAGCEATFMVADSDDDGMVVESLERAIHERRPKLIYIVTEFHNPKGTTLSLERRRRLVRLAQTHRIPILEDNPYGELRFRGEAPPPLAALDDEGVVMHLGTFSKTLAPGMRLGWMVGPRELVRAATIAKQAADLHTGTLAQRAAARLLKTFDYDGHLAALRPIYGERCVAMLRALEKHLPPGTRWTKPDGGLFVWAELPEGMSADEIFADALREKVAFVPGSAFFADAPKRQFLRLNYSNRPADLIEEGMARLGRVVARRMS